MVKAPDSPGATGEAAPQPVLTDVTPSGRSTEGVPAAHPATKPITIGIAKTLSTAILLIPTSLLGSVPG